MALRPSYVRGDKFMQRITRFFKKVDPVTVALVALLGVSTVFAWVQITGAGRTPEVAYVPEPTVPVWVPQEPTLPPPAAPAVATPEIFLAPIDASAIATPTTFFNENSDDATMLASSLFFFQVGAGKYSHPSQGMSFACKNGHAVNVIAPLTGVVSAVIDDDPVRGTIVRIDHDSGLQTILTGVYNVTVTTGDNVLQGDILGVTGLSRLEPDSGNVVHLEVFQAGSYINPEDVIGQRFTN